jgi:hypothetical protein
LAVVIISVVGIIAPFGISKQSTEENPIIVKSTVVKSTVVKSTVVKPATVKPTAVESGESTVDPTHRGNAAAVKSTTSAMESPTAAVRTGVGKIWLAERGCAQQRRCDCQSPSYPGPGSIFV